MLTIRNADERGTANMGWLNSRHTFSFGHYFDPSHMGFGPLRVINEDRVQPGEGFPPHGHQDMEILSYVLSGALEHKDNIGNGSVILPGDLQRMSAGTGIQHSEYNASKENLVHFLQIWIIPDTQGIAPGYEQISFDDDDKRGKFRLIGSRDGRDGTVTIHQDVNLHATLLSEGESASYELGDNRKAWLQVARGTARLNGEQLGTGDGVAVDGPAALTLEGTSEAEVLLFDMG